MWRNFPAAFSELKMGSIALIVAAGVPDVGSDFRADAFGQHPLVDLLPIRGAVEPVLRSNTSVVVGKSQSGISGVVLEVNSVLWVQLLTQTLASHARSEEGRRAMLSTGAQAQSRLPRREGGARPLQLAQGRAQIQTLSNSPVKLVENSGVQRVGDHPS